MYKIGLGNINGRESHSIMCSVKHIVRESNRKERDIRMGTHKDEMEFLDPIFGPNYDLVNLTTGKDRGIKKLIKDLYGFDKIFVLEDDYDILRKKLHYLDRSHSVLDIKKEDILNKVIKIDLESYKKEYEEIWPVSNMKLSELVFMSIIMTANNGFKEDVGVEYYYDSYDDVRRMGSVGIREEKYNNLSIIKRSILNPNPDRRYFNSRLEAFDGAINELKLDIQARFNLIESMEDELNDLKASLDELDSKLATLEKVRSLEDSFRK